MSAPLVSRSNVSRQPWFLGLLVLYALFELSFNHRLLQLSGGLQVDASAEHWQHLELWARVLSGVGLALLLMRGLARWVPSRAVLVLVCSVAGLWTMWHVQKAVVDVIVASADDRDLHMSVQSHISTGEAIKGRMVLRGQAVLEEPASPALRPVMHALWSSSVLGLTPEDLEATSGAAQLAGHWLQSPVSTEHMREAYRKAVMTPVALGASLAFGLLNLCQLLAAVSAVVLSRFGLAGSWGLERWLLWGWVAVCLGLSWWPGNAWVESPGYSQVARPALWQGKPFLAPFVDWSLRAEPVWSDPVAWVHRSLLRDFDFREPWRLAWLTVP